MHSGNTLSATQILERNKYMNLSEVLSSLRANQSGDASTTDSGEPGTGSGGTTEGGITTLPSGPKAK